MEGTLSFRLRDSRCDLRPANLSIDYIVVTLRGSNSSAIFMGFLDRSYLCVTFRNCFILLTFAVVGLCLMAGGGLLEGYSCQFLWGIMMTAENSGTISFSPLPFFKMKVCSLDSCNG